MDRLERIFGEAPSSSRPSIYPMLHDWTQTRQWLILQAMIVPMIILDIVLILT